MVCNLALIAAAVGAARACGFRLVVSCIFVTILEGGQRAHMLLLLPVNCCTSNIRETAFANAKMQQAEFLF